MPKPLCQSNELADSIENLGYKKESRVKKNNTIQLMRGIAIGVVLMHHSISQISPGGGGTTLNDLDSILICFHMPTFFMISGYLYEMSLKQGQKSFISFLSGKAKRLLIPYLFWTVILWFGVQVGNTLAGSFMREIGFPPMSVGDLIINIFTYEVYYIELLWFVYVLFLYFALHYVIGQIGRNQWFIAVSIVLGFSTVYVDYPNIVSRFLLWMVFFAVGRAIATDERVTGILRNAGKKTAYVTSAFIILSAARIALNHFDFGINMFILRGLNQFVKYALGFLGVWLIFILAFALEKTRCMPVLKTIGDYSYDIYLMHNPYVVAVTAIICSRILHLPGLCSMIIATALGITVPMVTSKLIIRRSKILSMVMIGN